MTFLKAIMFVLLFVLVSAHNAQAQHRDRDRDRGDRREGYAGQNEAARICERASFDSDRRACIEEVRSARHFDSEALRVCERISFSDGYPKCMRAIKDKRYQSFEVRECARESFDDGKITCLRRFGQGGGYGGGHNGGGYPDYGNGGGHGGHNGNMYGPGVTRRWMAAGEDKVEKVEVVKTIYLRGQLVNEVLLTATKEKVIVNSVVAHLSNGQAVLVQGLGGRLRTGQQMGARLDRRGSLRVDRIEINAISDIIGSRGVLRVDVGLAQ